MTSNQSLKKLRLFAASPSDVATERAKIETVVSLLKPLADHIGVFVEVVDWRQVVPDMGRPQQVIFNQLQPTTWDVFIGILWHRFGTPPGGKDPQTQKEYLSGTEEEFKTAFHLWEKFKQPRIRMYRCIRQVDLHAIDFDQAKKVQEFFAQCDTMKGEHPVLYQTFDSTEAFEKLLLDHLQKLLLEYSEKEKGHTVSPQEMQVLAPQSPDNLPRRAAFFGRTQEMETVLQALSPDERGWGAVIDGIGGIGKTALAVESAYRCKEAGQFEAFVFVSAKQKRLEPSGVKEQSPVVATLDEFVNETARVLGQTGIAKLTGEDKRRALLETLRSKRALLIYDNLETLTKEEQEALADFLRRFLPQGCKAILTSRRRGGEGALWLRLEKLTWEDARKIIVHETERDVKLQAKLQRTETRWQELYDATGGSPLALIHILGLMRVRVRLTFDAALSMLRQGATGELALQKFIYDEARKELSANDMAALNALSFFVSSASFEALMTVADLTRTALETVLERLSALSLVDILPGGERFALHPLIRTYIRDEVQADAITEQTIGMRSARYWVSYAERYGAVKENYNQYELEWRNLEAATNWLWEKATFKDDNTIRDKDVAQMLINLTKAIHFIAQQHLDYGEAKQLLDQILVILRNLDDDEQIVNVLNDLGKLTCEHKEYDAAERYYREALELSWHIEDQEKQIIHSGSLGELMLKQERCVEARPWFIQERNLAEGAGRVDLVAHGKYGIARTWEAEGQPDLALSLAQEALAVYERLQHRDLAATRELVQRLTATMQKGTNSPEK